MLIFSDPPLPSEGIAALATLIICTLTSTLLNPVVFLVSKRKKSVAGLMFCVLSLADLSNSLVSFSMVIFYAMTLQSPTNTDKHVVTADTGHDMQGMICPDYRRFPIDCYLRPATLTQIIWTSFSTIINFSAITVSGVMITVRFIQIRFPFFVINRRHVGLFLALIIGSSVLECFVIWFSQPDKEVLFIPAMFIVYIVNVMNLPIEDNMVNIVVTMVISYFPILIVQLSAMVTTVLTVLHLKREENRAPSTASRNNKLCTIKILLTNGNNMLLMFIMCLFSPAVMLMNSNQETDEITGLPLRTEKQSWTIFGICNLTPGVSATLNSVIFVCLSPECRDYVRWLMRRSNEENTNSSHN